MEREPVVAGCKFGEERVVLVGGGGIGCEAVCYVSG